MCFAYGQTGSGKTFVSYFLLSCNVDCVGKYFLVTESVISHNIQYFSKITQYNTIGPIFIPNWNFPLIQ